MVVRGRGGGWQVAGGRWPVKKLRPAAFRRL